MSTAIARNFQIGIDPTPTNNFTLYQPATPDGTLRLGNGNTGITSSLLTLTSAGDLGIGQTPTAYGATVRTVEAYIAGASGYTLVSASTASVRTEIASSEGSLLGQVGTRTNHPLVLKTSDTERMRIDSSGNVGIGTSSPSGRLDVEVASAVLYTNLSATSGGAASVLSLLGGSSSEQAICYNATALRFGTVTGKNGAGFTERARFDSSGNFIVGTTTPTPAGIAQQGNITVITASGKNGINVATIGPGNAIQFANTNFGQTGNIAVGASTTSYNTSSDYRLKHNIAPMTGALARVATLKPCTYKWNVDNSDGEGFIAHELAEVCPQAVTGEKDAVDKNGKPVYQGIDTSFLVATLTAAIQELKAEFDAYKATHP